MQTTTLNAAQYVVRFRRLVVFLTLTVFAVTLATACRTTPNEQSSTVVVNAPTDGVVRRVLVGEGATVDKDAAIIELAVQSEQPVASQPSNGKAEQTRALRAAETDLASAEGEANRTAGELRRIEPLVKRGLASQAELDKARAQSQDAQERLRLARERARKAQENRDQPPPTNANEQVIAVRVPAAGTIRALNVQAGQLVKIGQPLATLVSHT
jgi:multidrug efflux pump subunit AcrA (membrane-fusion protein)